MPELYALVEDVIVKLGDTALALAKAAPATLNCGVIVAVLLECPVNGLSNPLPKNGSLNDFAIALGKW